MGLLSASTSFVRYKIVEPVERSLWSEVQERLQRHAFQDIDHNAEERSYGWVCFDNMLDSMWHTAPPEKGQYLTFSLRLDTRRIPAAIFKKHFQLALEDLLHKTREQGKKFVTKDQKTELKEQVMLKLRTKTLPIPAFFEVAWDTDSNQVFLGSTSAKVCELFEELFQKTFGFDLERQTPFWAALQLMGAEAREALENLEPTQFV